MTKRTITATRKNLDAYCERQIALGKCVRGQCIANCPVSKTQELLLNAEKTFAVDEKMLLEKSLIDSGRDKDGNEYFSNLI